MVNSKLKMIAVSLFLSCSSAAFANSELDEAFAKAYAELDKKSSSVNNQSTQRAQRDQNDLNEMRQQMNKKQEKMRFETQEQQHQQRKIQNSLQNSKSASEYHAVRVLRNKISNAKYTLSSPQFIEVGGEVKYFISSKDKESIDKYFQKIKNDYRSLVGAHIQNTNFQPQNINIEDEAIEIFNGKEFVNFKIVALDKGQVIAQINNF